MRNQPISRLDQRAQSLLREVSRALLDAISESASVNSSLRRLHEEGYTLHLLLDCKRNGEVERSETVGVEPEFRIDTGDLAFLRSVGIDPTRRRRRPRSSAG